MKNKVVTIHQPNFMPWLGFFSKIYRSDTYVVLDHVVNKYNDQSWFRRVKLADKNGAYWFSISILKPFASSHISINSMDINNCINYNKHLQTIKQHYSKAPYFEKIYPIVENWFNINNKSLVTRNMNFIKEILRLLDIKTDIIYSSNLNIKYKSNEMLIEILGKLSADIYLCGNGSESYQNDQLFISNGIKVEYSNFRIKEYNQINTKEFIGGLSIIDTLMNIGPSETKKLL